MSHTTQNQIRAARKIAKSVGDSRRFYFDFTERMLDTDTVATIASVTEYTSYGDLTIDTGSAAIVSAESTIDGKVIAANKAVEVPIGGGALDDDGNPVEYILKCSITTTGGDELDLFGILVITDQ